MMCGRSDGMTLLSSIIRPVLVPSTGLLVLLMFFLSFFLGFFQFPNKCGFLHSHTSLSFTVHLCDTLPVTSSTGHCQHLLANVYVHDIFAF